MLIYTVIFRFNMRINNQYWTSRRKKIEQCIKTFRRYGKKKETEICQHNKNKIDIKNKYKNKWKDVDKNKSYN